MRKRTGAIIYFSAALFLSALAQADEKSCSAARTAAGTEYDSGIGTASYVDDRNALATELAARLTSYVRDRFTQEIRDRVFAYNTLTYDRMTTEELRDLLKGSLAGTVVGPTCAETTDNVVPEQGYANNPSTQNGYHLCRKTVRTKISYLGNALNQAKTFFLNPFSCGSVVLDCTMNTMYLGPEISNTYTYSYPLTDSSIDLIGPTDDPVKNAAAPAGPGRFRLRMCEASSHDGTRSARLCVTTSLEGLVAAKASVTSGHVFTAQEMLSRTRDGTGPTNREQFVDLQSRELCATAQLDRPSDNRVAIAGAIDAEKTGAPISAPGAAPDTGSPARRLVPAGAGG
jgi:hypothetical protein